MSTTASVKPAPWWQAYCVDVPEGQSGDWAVERFEVSPQDEELGRLRAMFSSSSRGRYVPVGVYTRLTCRDDVIMSDTPDEIGDHRWAFRNAIGECLVNGLGLGVVANAMLMRDEVDKVTVVEISKDVIKLIGPWLSGRYADRVDIVHCDAFKFKPPRGVRYGMVWHDIWPTICSDNLSQMATLHRKYGRRADRQGSWCKEQCRQYSRRGY